MKVNSCHPEEPHYCKNLCKKCYQNNRRQNNPTYVAYMKAYQAMYKETRPDVIKRNYEARRADPVKRVRDKQTHRNAACRAKYGISYQDALDLLARQNHGCALCERPLVHSRMQIDHCHETGRVRGILCVRCNTGLGSLGDNEVGLAKALSYVAGSARKDELLAQSSPVEKL